MKPEETLDYHFRKIWHGISRAYNVEAAKHGITMSVGFALISIDKEGTPSTHLGPLMGMESRSLTRMLKNLEEWGWIERRPDKKDKRVVRLFLTELGKKKRKIARDKVLKFNNHIRGGIDEKDLQIFFKVCNKVSNILEDNNIFSDEQKND